jgi:hypothetical protein
MEKYIDGMAEDKIRWGSAEHLAVKAPQGSSVRT